MMRPSRIHSRPQRGAALIEALVAMLIVAFGVLGFVGLQARTAVSTLEGYQRAQALVLLADMNQRISINRKAALEYLDAGAARTDIGAPVDTPTRLADCTGLAGSAFDLCEWGNLLRGAADLTGDGKAETGAMINARGCIQGTTGVPGEYRVAVVWQGVTATADSAITCATPSVTYPTGTRRGVSTVVRIATLS